MTINYGKRNGGALTASSPGDTLYIPLNFYNDSGASISIGSSLAVTDIEVFKDGSVAQRATDSGYAILGDTGNFDERIGFKGISISLFNTSDDPSFYAAGSSYWVAIDSVTVDARTVRFFPAVFEIGEPRANVVQMNGDTGAASVLQQFAATGGTLSPTGGLDTGSVDNNSYLPANVIRLEGDTGAVDVLQKAFADTGSGGAGAAWITDAVWDEALTGATHNVATSSGRRLRQVGAISSEDASVNDAAATTTVFVTTLASAVNDFYKDQLLVFTSGALTGQSRPVAAYVGATNSITLSEALTSAPANGDTFTMWANHIHPIEQIAGAVWDEADTGHTDTGTFGRLRQTSLSAIKTKTDSLTFTVAGNVDANIQRVNDVAVSGTGAAGDEWGP